MKHIMIRILLCISGAILLIVGVAVLFHLQSFSEATEKVLIADPDLMSELRSPGGLLIMSGFVILFGAARKELTHLALMLSTLLYGTFGISRIVGIIFDGMPSTSLLSAMAVELIVGMLSLVAIFSQRKAQGTDQLTHDIG